ncbi:MAG: antibiotic biosynthesis monooxygenase [Anaerolineae bacterium]|nr:antibiotic biosynthesis monooxygenase [Anaerolineae bacterium]
MAIYMTAQFSVRRESVERCQQAITDLVDHITRNEPETRMYISMQEVEHQTNFLHFFIFENENAEARHAQSEALRLFTEVIQSECLEPVVFTTYTLVASTEE